MTADRINGTAELTVARHGPRCARAAADRVFERFFTGDAARGSGLGLAIARELADRMSGKIELRSRPGKTAFTLELPAVGPRTARREAAPQLLAMRPRGARRRGLRRRWRQQQPAGGRHRPCNRPEQQGPGGRRQRRRRARAGFNPAAIYRQYSPGVVTVISVLPGSGDLFGGVAAAAEEALGSGFVVDGYGRRGHERPRGHHRRGRRTSSAPTQVYVEFPDHNRVPAKIVGDDPNADVALLKISHGRPQAHAAPARATPRPHRRLAGRRDRQPVRRGAVAVGRRDLGASTAASPRSPPSTSTTRSRRTPRSTTATPAARCSTARAR